jgi:polyhydroxyalkanoate synthesis regulator phasin
MSKPGIDDKTFDSFLDAWINRVVDTIMFKKKEEGKSSYELLKEVMKEGNIKPPTRKEYLQQVVRYERRHRTSRDESIKATCKDFLNGLKPANLAIYIARKSDPELGSKRVSALDQLNNFLELIEANTVDRKEFNKKIEELEEWRTWHTDTYNNDSVEENIIEQVIEKILKDAMSAGME